MASKERISGLHTNKATKGEIIAFAAVAELGYAAGRLYGKRRTRIAAEIQERDHMRAHRWSQEVGESLGQPERNEDGELDVKEMLHFDPRLRYARMMTHRTIPQRAREALRGSETRFVFVNGSEDPVGRLRATARLVKQLQSEFGKDRVSHTVIEGDGHLALAHPKLLALFIKSQLDGSFL